MSKPLYRDEEWLREQYRDLSRSSIDIADQCDVNPATICKWLNRHGIEIRSDREQAKQYSDSDEWRKSISDTKTDGRSEQLQNEQWLREQYVDKDLSTYEIAELVGVTRPTVCNWLNRHGIEIADPGPENPGKVDQLRDEEWLRAQYVDERRPTTSIAEQLDVDHKTVRSYLRSHGIEIREMRGSDHPQWKGGYDEYYGPQWDEQREKALRRDQYRCQDCGIIEPDHRQKWDTGLNVHHIIPYRKFHSDSKAHELENLITLCLSCHKVAEHDSKVIA